MAQSTTTSGFHNLKRHCIIKDSISPFWDIKFYPYLVKEDDPVIFAVVGFYHVLVYNAINKTEQEPAQVKLVGTYSLPADKQHFVFSMNCLTWCYTNVNEPLLAVSGETGQIMVLRPLSGEVVATITGHGQGVVNQLATHPKYPWIIASASIDNSIRIWDIRRMHNTTLSTCIIVCGHNLGHKEGVISIDWHDSGRYLVSGGFDYKVCVWTLPDLQPQSRFWHEISREGRQRSRDEVKIIYYPHFISSAIHSNTVDTVMWLGDLVISKAANENKIVLWAITGFSVEREPPPMRSAVKTQEHLETTNGFMRQANLYMDDDLFDHANQRHIGAQVYRRCMEFDVPNCESFYTRFGLARPSKLFPNARFTLSIGNHVSVIRHWDLSAFIDGFNTVDTLAKSKRKATHAKPSSKFKGLRAPSEQSGSSVPALPMASSNSVSPSRPSSADVTISETSIQQVSDRSKFPLHQPTVRLKSHQEFDEASKVFFDFTARGSAWSCCGQWFVAVGAEAARRDPKDKNRELPDRGAIIVYLRQE